MKGENPYLGGPSTGVIYGIFIALAGLILPLLLIPIVKLTGYSEVAEELSKAAVILFLVLRLPNRKMQLVAGITFGVLFSLSETCLYLNQIIQLGDFGVLIGRLVWTLPMHVLTVLIILFASMSGRVFGVFGIIGAVAVHSIFNVLIVDLVK